MDDEEEEVVVEVRMPSAAREAGPSKGYKGTSSTPKLVAAGGAERRMVTVTVYKVVARLPLGMYSHHARPRRLALRHLALQAHVQGTLL